MSFGNFIKQRRKKMHITAGQLVRRLGKRWSAERLNVIEEGHAHPSALRPEDFEELSVALDVDVDLLIAETDLCPHCLGTGRK